MNKEEKAKFCSIFMAVSGRWLYYQRPDEEEESDYMTMVWKFVDDVLHSNPAMGYLYKKKSLFNQDGYELFDFNLYDAFVIYNNDAGRPLACFNDNRSDFTDTSRIWAWAYGCRAHKGDVSLEEARKYITECISGSVKIAGEKMDYRHNEEARFVLVNDTRLYNNMEFQRYLYLDKVSSKYCPSLKRLFFDFNDFSDRLIGKIVGDISGFGETSAIEDHVEGFCKAYADFVKSIMAGKAPKGDLSKMTEEMFIARGKQQESFSCFREVLQRKLENFIDNCDKSDLAKFLIEGYKLFGINGGYPNSLSKEAAKIVKDNVFKVDEDVQYDFDANKRCYGYLETILCAFIGCPDISAVKALYGGEIQYDNYR